MGPAYAPAMGPMGPPQSGPYFPRQPRYPGPAPWPPLDPRDNGYFEPETGYYGDELMSNGEEVLDFDDLPGETIDLTKEEDGHRNWRVTKVKVNNVGQRPQPSAYPPLRRRGPPPQMYPSPRPYYPQQSYGYPPYPY